MYGKHRLYRHTLHSTFAGCPEVYITGCSMLSHNEGSVLVYNG